jgi:hypothetical protein
MPYFDSALAEATEPGTLLFLVGHSLEVAKSP